MITIFILLVGDDWNAIMFDYVRATNKWTVLFFVVTTCIGNLLLLNLFLAILLKDFENTHDPLDAETKQKTILEKVKGLWVSIKDAICM